MSWVIILGKFCVLTTFWAVWLERDARIFEEKMD